MQSRDEQRAFLVVIVQNIICTRNVIMSNIWKSLYLSCTELSINQIFPPYLTLSPP